MKKAMVRGAGVIVSLAFLIVCFPLDIHAASLDVVPGGLPGVGAAEELDDSEVAADLEIDENYIEDEEGWLDDEEEPDEIDEVWEDDVWEDDDTEEDAEETDSETSENNADNHKKNTTNTVQMKSLNTYDRSFRTGVQDYATFMLVTTGVLLFVAIICGAWAYRIKKNAR